MAVGFCAVCNRKFTVGEGIIVSRCPQCFREYEKKVRKEQECDV